MPKFKLEKGSNPGAILPTQATCARRSAAEAHAWIMSKCIHSCGGPPCKAHQNITVTGQAVLPNLVVLCLLPCPCPIEFLTRIQFRMA
jgi:hypothetical protein